MTVIRKFSLLALLAIGALALVACGGDDAADASATAEGSTTAEASATEGSGSDEETLAFTLVDFEVDGPDNVSAGTIRFDTKNDGTQPHELVIVRSDAEPDALPVVDGLVPEEDLDIIGEIEEFPQGEERSSTFTLDAGRYLLICNIATHYQLGMVSVLTVE